MAASSAMTSGSSEPTRAACDAGIRAFWAWWPEARIRIEAAIPTQEWGTLSDEITEKVKAIHPKIAWEMGSGTKPGTQMLCLSAQGAAAHRGITERWFRAAPTENPAWEFHPARVAKPEFAEHTIQIGGYAIELPAYRLGCEEDPVTERFHLRVWHPQHPDILEDLQGELFLVVLDGLLGEDEVERWVGSIQLSDEKPEGELVSLSELKERVGDLMKRATHERFCLLEAMGPEGQPMAATINMALKRIDHVHAEMRLDVSVALNDPTELGLADSDEIEALGELEDELLDALGPDVAYLGKVTFAGRCTFHFFVPDASSVPSRVEAWRAEHPDREIEVTQEADPEWTLQQQFEPSAED